MLFSIVTLLMIALSSALECGDASNSNDCVNIGSQGIGACVWCGASSTDGTCSSPAWAGVNSCPCSNEPRCMPFYGCPNGTTTVFCGSSCKSGAEPCPPYEPSNAQYSFFLEFYGNCSELPQNSYKCAFTTTSQQSLTLIEPGQVVYSSQTVPAGGKAFMIFSGTNPTDTTFSESGAVQLSGDAGPIFKFTGSGMIQRNPNKTEILGSGSYTVTGVGGIYSGLNGMMTALNHGTSDGYFTSHLYVRFEYSL